MEKGGETVNKKVLVLAFSLLMLVFAVAPVIADPTKGQKVPAEQYPGSSVTTPTVCPRNGVTYPYTGTFRLVDDGVLHTYDSGNVLKTKLVIHYDTGVVTLDGLSFNNYDRLWKFAENLVSTGSDAVYHYDAIWWFPTVEGGFEGNINLQITDYNGPNVNIKTNCLLQGYGSFEGQTVQLSIDAPMNIVWNGYLLKP